MYWRINILVSLSSDLGFTARRDSSLHLSTMLDLWWLTFCQRRQQWSVATWQAQHLKMFVFVVQEQCSFYYWSDNWSFHIFIHPHHFCLFWGHAIQCYESFVFSGSINRSLWPLWFKHGKYLKNVKCINYMPLGVILFEDIPVGEFMYLVFTRMPGESYRRRLRSLLLCLSDVFRELINSLVLMRQLFV